MKKEFSSCGDHAEAIVQSKGGSVEFLGMHGYYHVQCFGADGKLKWEEGFENQVVQGAKQLMLDNFLRGNAYTLVGPYCGLIAGPATAGAAVSSLTYTTTVATVNTSTAHGLTTGASIVVAGATPSPLNGGFVVTGTPTSNQFTYAATNGSSGTATGTISYTYSNYSPTDVMTSHTGWTEFTNYTGNRNTATFGASTTNGSTTNGGNVVTSTASSMNFNISGAGGTVGGCFIVLGTGAVNTPGSTAGTLYSAGGFSTTKTTTSGDVIVVSYSTTATS